MVKGKATGKTKAKAGKVDAAKVKAARHAPLEVFEAMPEALEYLTGQGWKISASGLRLHQKQGKLAFDVPGGWSRAELDRYAATCLKRKDTGRKVDQQDAAALELARQRKKYELDCLKVEKAQAELEAEREGHLSRDEVGRMLVARGALFSNLVFAMVQEKAPDWIDLVGGRHDRTHELIGVVFDDFQAALAVFGAGVEMEVELDEGGAAPPVEVAE